MKTIKEDIKAVDGDRMTLFRAKALRIYTNLKWRLQILAWWIYVVFNGFRF